MSAAGTLLGYLGLATAGLLIASGIALLPLGWYSGRRRRLRDARRRARARREMIPPYDERLSDDEIARLREKICRTTLSPDSTTDRMTRRPRVDIEDPGWRQLACGCWQRWIHGDIITSHFRGWVTVFSCERCGQATADRAPVTDLSAHKETETFEC